MNTDFKKHIDNKSIELVDKLEQRTLPSEKKRERNNSFSQNHEVLLHLNIDKVEGICHIMELDKKISIWFEKENTRVGFDKNYYQNFSKFITSILKDVSICNVTDFDFLEKTIFDWVISTNHSKRSDCNLSDYILEKLNSKVQEYIFSFKISNLHVSTPIYIGNCKIHFLTKEDLDKIIHDAPEKLELDEIKLREDCQGKVVITTSQKATKKKALNKAIKECFFAMDILKICSDTIVSPQTPLHFDIEERVTFKDTCEYFSYEKIDFKKFSITTYFQGVISEIDEEYFNRISSRFFKEICDWYENLNFTELNRLIQLAISNFALCLSLNDHHKRIADLFSIFESLLIPGENSGILDSLKKYGSKLVFTQPKDRKHLKQIFIKLYKVRSSLVHHGKKIDFDMSQLEQLQLALLMLITNLINLSSKHNTKSSILKEIDNALEAAY